jgi:hypothetical protein
MMAHCFFVNTFLFSEYRRVNPWPLRTITYFNDLHPIVCHTSGETYTGRYISYRSIHKESIKSGTCTNNTEYF